MLTSKQKQRKNYYSRIFRISDPGEMFTATWGDDISLFL
jgi:hypothetical protein